MIKVIYELTLNPESDGEILKNLAARIFRLHADELEEPSEFGKPCPSSPGHSIQADYGKAHLQVISIEVLK